MVDSKSTGASRARQSAHLFTFTLAAFLAGAAIGAFAAHTPRPARDPEQPNEIGVYIPDGKGSHNSPRLLVRTAHTNTDQPGPLPADQWQVILFYHPPTDDGPVRTVTYRCQPR